MSWEIRTCSLTTSECSASAAIKKGWTVAEEHIYSDDDISGAEFAKRPGFLRLMNALKPRPAFQVLIMSEESRLGRKQIDIERRAEVERELAQAQQRLDRLVDALADDSLPADEIRTRLSAEKARKTNLSADLARLERLARVASLNIDQIAQKLRARVNDVAGVLGRQTVQARQMLRKILADKIALEPVGAGRQRGYNFRGTLSLERLIEGEAMSNTSDGGGPNGTRSNLQNSNA